MIWFISTLSMQNLAAKFTMLNANGVDLLSVSYTLPLRVVLMFY